HGLRYLTFPWDDALDCVLFDGGGGNMVVRQLAGFIDEALDAGDAVLVHSVQGTSRCVAAVAAYLMFKFGWGIQKAFEFVASKRPDIAPNEGFMQQLHLLDRRLCAARFPTPEDITPADRVRHDEWAVEEMALVHTFLNSQPLVDSIAPP
ncbi:unnamed protein product, partial [Phaeothamnion confervicola]